MCKFDRRQRKGLQECVQRREAENYLKGICQKRELCCPLRFYQLSSEKCRHLWVSSALYLHRGRIHVLNIYTSPRVLLNENSDKPLLCLCAGSSVTLLLLHPLCCVQSHRRPVPCDLQVIKPVRDDSQRQAVTRDMVC